MKYVLYILLILVGLLLLAVLAAVLHTLFMPKKRSGYTPVGDDKRALAYGRKLAQMVQFETVSHAGKPEPEKFRDFHAVLKALFPLVFEKLEKTDIDGNLLMHWKGKASDKPILLMSHQDVVPAEGTWKHPPFSGDIADGKVWGRGTGDTKCSVMAFYQAVEELLEQGYVPEQDVYLASSCTEEISGDGGPKIVKELQRRGVKLEMVCDEGGGIISEPIAGVAGSYAMIGALEKGRAEVRFVARSAGGHASAPGKNTPVARLAAFVNHVEKHNPFKSKLEPQVVSMFSALAPYSSFGMRLIFSNLWLFGPLMKVVLPAVSAQAGAMLRTTIAFTMMSGSDASNVLPQEASVTADMRFIPHQDMQESLDVITKLARKYDLEVELIRGSASCPPVNVKGEAYGRVASAIGSCFPGLAASPYVMTGATDARFYSAVSDNCFRFAPVVYGPEQMKGMHGIDENIEYNCLPGAVEFYKALIQQK